MRSTLIGLGMLASALVGLGYALWVLTYDAPIHFHLLFADYPNPNGHGLKGVVVTTPELLLHLAVAVVCAGLAVRLWRALRRLDQDGGRGL